MTANVAQAIADPYTWRKTLRGAYEALRRGGYLIFETRDPTRRAWEEWTRKISCRATDVPGVGTVEHWVELVQVSGPLVAFRQTCVFAADGQKLTSDSTLRFPEQDEVERDLGAHGYVVKKSAMRLTDQKENSSSRRDVHDGLDPAQRSAASSSNERSYRSQS